MFTPRPDLDADVALASNLLQRTIKQYDNLPSTVYAHGSALEKACLRSKKRPCIVRPSSDDNTVHSEYSQADDTASGAGSLLNPFRLPCAREC